MARIGRSIPQTYGYIVPIVVAGADSPLRVTPLSQDQAVANRLLPPYRRTMTDLRPPATLAPAAVFVAPPMRTHLVAVNTARRGIGRYPIEGWGPWLTQTTAISSVVLDDFNRADGALGANWGTPIFAGDQAFAVVSNQANRASGFPENYWLPAQFGPDCEVFATYISGGAPGLWLRLNTPGGAFTGYRAQWNIATNEVEIARYTAGAQAASATMLTTSPVAGDVLAFRAVGSTLIALKNGVAVWSWVDSVYSAAGYIGISGNNNDNATFDNFGGGGPAVWGGQKHYHNLDLRPPTVINATTPVAPPIKSVQVAVRAARRVRTKSVLRPPAVLTSQAAPPLRKALTRTRPRSTVYQLRRPTTLRVFSGPRSVLTRARPRPTVHVLRPAQVVLVPSVELKEETIRVVLVRGRAGKTDYRLNPPTVVFAPAVFTGPTSRLTRIRPPHTVTRLSPPAVVAPRPLAPPLASCLVRTRPQHTIYRLEPPTTLTVFPGPRSELTRTRPQPTTTVLVPAQVVRNPHVEQQLRTLRVRLVRTRPQPTTTLLRPPAVVLTPIPPEIDIHTAIVRGRRPIAKSKLFRPATLEPFSIQLREQTIRVALVRVRPRHTTLKLRPPTVLAVLRFSTGKPVLVRARPRDTVATLRGPVVLHTFTTGETRLVTTRPRHTTTVLRPPAVVRQRPQVTQIRSALVTARPQPTTRVLRAPAALRVFAGPAVRLTRIRPRHTVARLFPPTVVTPFVAPVSASIRSWLTRIRPPRTLAQLFPPRRLKNVPGTACLTDHAKFDSCLTDQLAAEACLDDAELSTEACLTDQAQAVACLVDMSAATATLRDEE